MTNEKRSYNQRLKSIGPGLLFASSAIGTSHLVLSTRAGATHGMIYFWIILLALILKYPISFLLSPIIAFLNLRAIQSTSVPASYRPSAFMMGLAYLGLVALVAFSIYYLIEL